MSRTRVLFVAEAVTLAHVARARVLAAMLSPPEFSVSLACDARFDFLFDAPSLERLPLQSISSEAFGRALRRGTPIYDGATLDRYVADDLRVIEATKPDVVVGDFRLSLNVSARLAGVPYLNVTNAGWSPWARSRFPVPDTIFTDLVGVRAAQWIFDRVRPAIFAVHAGPLNRLRRRHGLPAFAGDIRTAYTDADRVLYADLPELIPTPGAPPTHRYLGPLLWSPKTASASWESDVPVDRPLIYVSLGSSGDASLLPSVLDGLSRLPVAVVASTAGHASPVASREHLFVAPYLAGERWARRASLVVCNGGSPTCYQSLAEGVPVLGIPGNLDQYLNMAAVETSGAGRLVRAGGRMAARVTDAAQGMLAAPAWKDAARRLADRIAANDPAANFISAIREATGRGSASAP